MIKAIGDNPDREGLRDTPGRVVSSWNELFSGYKENPAKLLRSFDTEYSGMVIARNIEFHSTCEHHLLPFSGVGHVAYLPTGGRVIGASKLSRLLWAFARRLQIQERIAEQTVAALMKYVKPTPDGAACILEARHACMVCRGVMQSGQDFVTPVYQGAFMDDPATRAELLSLIALRRSNPF